jgi:hypothetical protein
MRGKAPPRPHNLNIDSNTELFGLSSTKTKNSQKLLAEALSGMKNKLRKAHWWLTGIREDGTMYKVPSTIRGNETYAYYQSVRIHQIQQYLSDNIQIKRENENVSATNALFITLTQKYNPEDEESVKRTWTNMREASKRFKTKMRKMGMKEYVMTLEAHANGGCHAHMIAMFGNRGIGIHKCPVKKMKMKYRNGKEYVYRLNDTELLYKIKKAWADALRYSLDSAFLDIIGCGDDDLAGYVTKELKKASSCERAIKLLEKNEGTKEQKKAARKKVLAFHFAGVLKMRLLNVSRGMGADAEPEEDELPETEFIMNVITEPTKAPKVLYSCIITRAELLKLIKYDKISPYTGTVEKNTEEYDAIMSIFDRLYGISKVLNDKKEIEKVIMKREEIKNMKMQTKMTAQEAIYA